MLKAIFPGRHVALTLDAEKYLADLLNGAASRANLARLLECRGVSCGLSDALWAVQGARRRAQAASASATAFSQDSSGTLRTAEVGPDWWPRSRVRRAAGMGEADRILTQKWCGRLAAALEKGSTPGRDRG